MAKSAAIAVNLQGEEILLQSGGTVQGVDSIQTSGDTQTLDPTKNIELTKFQTKQELDDSIVDGSAVPGQFVVTTDEVPEQGIYNVYPDLSTKQQVATGSGSNSDVNINWIATEDCYVITNYEGGGTNGVNELRLSVDGTAVFNYLGNEAETNGVSSALYFVEAGQIVTVRYWGAGGIDVSRLHLSKFSVTSKQFHLVKTNELLTMGPPDYANMETISRISTNNGTWTADRDGYVFCAGSGANFDVNFYVNEKVATNLFSFSNTQIGTILQIKKNDIVRITANSNFNCLFIPPVINPPVYLESAPLIDYSTVEQDTGRKWIDGHSIYQRTFAVNNVSWGAGAGWIGNLGISFSGMSKIMPGSCTFVINDNRIYEFESCSLNLGFYVAEGAINNVSGYITLRYTKA